RVRTGVGAAAGALRGPVLRGPGPARVFAQAHWRVTSRTVDFRLTAAPAAAELDVHVAADMQALHDAVRAGRETHERPAHHVDGEREGVVLVVLQRRAETVVRPDESPVLEGDAGRAVGGVLVGANVGGRGQRRPRARVPGGRARTHRLRGAGGLLLYDLSQERVPVLRRQAEEAVDDGVAQRLVHARAVQVG